MKSVHLIVTSVRPLCTIVILLVCACSPDPFRCPSPTPDKVKKSSVNRMKLYQLQRQEYLMAKSQDKAYEDMIRSQQRQIKKIDPEEWDCPRPGSAHARLLAKHRRKLEAQNARDLKKKPIAAQLSANGTKD